MADKKAEPVRFHLATLKEELDRLDPRDFVASSQYDFLVARTEVTQWAEWSSPGHLEHIALVARKVMEVLDGYAGEGSHITTRSFLFVNDPELRAIVERDYKELSLVLLPGGAWKSAVIMAGSVLEAILFNFLEGDPVRKTAALASTKAPKERGGVVRQIEGEKWKLIDLINVAADIGSIPANRANTFDQTLRDYRNFVHPNKEVRSGHPCTEAEALMAKGALDGVCNHLEGNV